MKKTIIFICLTLLGSISCSQNKKNFNLATGAEGGSYINVGNKIAAVINENSSYKFNIIKGQNCNSPANCRKLLQGEADFAIAQNDVSYIQLLEEYPQFNDNIPIRTVMPLYNEVCFRWVLLITPSISFSKII